MMNESVLPIFAEGEDYCKKLKKMDFENSKLGAEVTYNMICMAAEAMLSAILIKNNSAVEHGSISAMLRTASNYMPVRLGLIDEARFINRFHTWCALDAIPSRKANPEELRRMVFCVEEIQGIVKCYIEN
jgi:hypothetical protein